MALKFNWSLQYIKYTDLHLNCLVLMEVPVVQQLLILMQCRTDFFQNDQVAWLHIILISKREEHIQLQCRTFITFMYTIFVHPYFLMYESRVLFLSQNEWAVCLQIIYAAHVYTCRCRCIYTYATWRKLLCINKLYISFTIFCLV